MSLFLGTTPLNDTDMYTSDMFHEGIPLSIDIALKSDKYYAVIMVDASKDGYLHLLKINLTSKTFKNMNNIGSGVPYKPPSPPKNDEYHKYFIYVFEMSQPIENFVNPHGGDSFDMREFMNYYKIIIVSKPKIFSFNVVH